MYFPQTSRVFLFIIRIAENLNFVRVLLFVIFFLADEINRTSSKTESALLELMEEKRITVDGNTYKLPEPYTVIATQNPIGSAGTHNLPDSQLDRFMIKLSMGYPDFNGEVSILKSKADSKSARKCSTCC